MPCRPNRLPNSAKVYLYYLDNCAFLTNITFHFHFFLHIFQLRFHFIIFRLYLACR